MPLALPCNNLYKTDLRIQMMQRRGAIEMSITTVVVLVLGMTMLILGLGLVRGIFGTATDSVDQIDQKVKSEIAQLFSDDQQDVVILLGKDKTAAIKASDKPFGIVVGARTPDGAAATAGRLKLQLTLDDSSTKYCLAVLGKAKTEGVFVPRFGQDLEFDEFDGANAFFKIQVQIPEGTKECSQKILVDVKDTTTGQPLGRNSFIINIVKPGLF